MNLQSLKGRSFPSQIFGCWLVDQVSPTIEGRSRLLSPDLKHEAWVWTRHLVDAFEALDEDSDRADALAEKARANL